MTIVKSQRCGTHWRRLFLHDARLGFWTSFCSNRNWELEEIIVTAAVYPSIVQLCVLFGSHFWSILYCVACNFVLKLDMFKNCPFFQLHKTIPILMIAFGLLLFHYSMLYWSCCNYYIPICCLHIGYSFQLNFSVLFSYVCLSKLFSHLYLVL